MTDKRDMSSAKLDENQVRISKIKKNETYDLCLDIWLTCQNLHV